VTWAFYLFGIVALKTFFLLVLLYFRGYKKIRMIVRLFLLSISVIFFSCEKRIDPVIEVIEEEESVRNIDFDPCDSYFRNIGKVYESGSDTYLWAGDEITSHFKITEWELNECNLLYGLGREIFPALMDPQYVDINTIENFYEESERCLVVHAPNYTKVYPYELMISHEVINEVINGEPIMIAYCVLANLGAVYTREYCGQTLTFAVSGYTYYEPEIWDGIDAFVLWDRDTESLWWPLIDKAISGTLHDTKLEKYNEGNWEVLRWSEIKTRYPEALVLDNGQRPPAPRSWPQLNVDDFDCN